jgi:two-component system LytT family sensor kinase
MPNKLPQKIPLKILIRESSKLFVFFTLGTLLIASLQDFDFKTTVQRGVSLTTLFTVLFAINTSIIYYLDQKRKSNSERIWRRAFLLGYLCSVIVFFSHHQIVEWLADKGIADVLQRTPKLYGWRLYVFIMYSSLVVYSFIFLIQNFVLDQYEKSRINMELLELKASNSEAVNKLLQQQIQPHFLFNALNILKSLIRKNPKSAEDYLLRLSDFLRISITKNKSGVATIEEELKVCNDYMEMQKIRFGAALQYKVDLNANELILKKKLPFFSLQPLLENAIKHNELTADNPLYIKIEREGNFIKVSNNIQTRRVAEVSTGNGHEMLMERYRILNGKPPVFKTEGEIYTVSMEILDSDKKEVFSADISNCIFRRD